MALGSDLLGWPGKEIPSVSPEKGLVPTQNSGKRMSNGCCKKDDFVLKF